MADAKTLSQALKAIKKAAEGDDPKKLVACCGDLCHAVVAHGKSPTPAAPAKAGAAKHPEDDEIQECLDCLEECKESCADAEVKDNKKVAGPLGQGQIWKTLGPIAIDFLTTLLKQLLQNQGGGTASTATKSGSTEEETE